MPVLPIAYLALTLLFAVAAVFEHSFVFGFMATACSYGTLVQVQLTRKRKQREIESLNL